MGRNTRSVIKDRIPQSKLDAMIQKVVQQEPQEVRPVLTDHLEYDSMHPEDVVKNFSSSIKAMLERYQYDKDQYVLYEQKMQDLLHYIEMTADKNANLGFKLYKQLAEVRRQRRICKNEMDLLQPIYDEYSDNTKLNALAKLLGNCRFAKQSIDNRVYTVRTDALEPYFKGRD